MKKIIIFDTTLRDGEQVPGAKMNTIEKIEVAKQLEKLGVNVIEAGFPISSPEDFNSVSEVAKTIKNATVCALARGLDKDIEVAYQSIKSAADPRIHTFISASDIHIFNQMKKTREEVLEMVKHAVSKAKSYVSNIEFSPMDASRADFDYLVEFIKVAIKAGATTINIPDTVGYAIPEEWGEMIKNLISAIPEFNDEVVLSVHTHNDLGLATANALAGIANGARQIEGTINGIGERAGNAANEEIIMAIETRYKDKFKTTINKNEIYKTSRLVSQITGLQVQVNKAIVGANAFAHSSGIHQDGIIKHRQNFEIIDPKDIGIDESGIILTARSGRSALIHRLQKIGYTVDKSNIDPIYDRFLQMADNKKEVYDDDLHKLMGSKDNEINDSVFDLELIQVLCGNKNIPTSTIQIKNKANNQVVESVSTGTGPIDSSFKAIDKIIDKEIQLSEYLVQAITEGIDATGKVTVKIKYSDREFFGEGEDSDIVVASAKAYLNAINKIS